MCVYVCKLAYVRGENICLYEGKFPLCRNGSFLMHTKYTIQLYSLDESCASLDCSTRDHQATVQMWFSQ